MSASLCLLSALLSAVGAFNIYSVPVYKFGPEKSNFGYAVAMHKIKQKEPVMLVGAPFDSSSGDRFSGAFFSCPLNSYHSSSYGEEWCVQRDIEKSSSSKLSHRRRQLLGASLSSSADGAVVCAPLARFSSTPPVNEPVEHGDGVCYVLNNELEIKSRIHTCENLPHGGRHALYGRCMDGFSVDYVAVPNDKGFEGFVATGAPGAVDQQGGVSVRNLQQTHNTDSPSSMSVSPKEKKNYRLVSEILKLNITDGHGNAKYEDDVYFGFSVAVGRFGMWYEEENRIAFTLATGAPRKSGHGAVFFFPFTPKPKGLDYEYLNMSAFHLPGDTLASSFGYSLAVVDLNSDGYDDLVVGAPFYYKIDAEGRHGGAVYVYFAKRQENKKPIDDFKVNDWPHVFEKPILLVGKKESQFGLSLAALGDVNKDGYNDFAVGAPYEGNGAVYVFHGAANRDEFLRKPAQVIAAPDASRLLPGRRGDLKTFGFSVAGGVDVDENGYPDLLVGAFDSDAVMLFRSRPVITIETSILNEAELAIMKDEGCNEADQTCLKFTTVLELKKGKAAGTMLKCSIEVLPYEYGMGPRAGIKNTAGGRQEAAPKMDWDCNAPTVGNPEKKEVLVVIDKSNRDWRKPIKFNFSVATQHSPTTEPPRPRQHWVDLKNYPVLDSTVSAVQVPFDKRCGSDNTCYSDLRVKCSLIHARFNKKDGVYVSETTAERHSLVLLVTVKNVEENAYETTLFINYEGKLFDPPTLEKLTNATGVKDLKRHGLNLTLLELGNPLEGNTTVTFKVYFTLSIGDAGSLGKRLTFAIHANSTSHAKRHPSPLNFCSVDVEVIKNAELVLTGVSDPQDVLYGGETRTESAVRGGPETAIGPAIVHTFALVNEGPWSVSGVSVEVAFPFELSSGGSGSRRVLYLLEMPFVTRGGHEEPVECLVDETRVNPLKLELSEDASPRPIDQQPADKEIDEPTRTATASVNYFGSSEPVLIKCGATARCLNITCQVGLLDNGDGAEIKIRSRLWNTTFLENFADVPHVLILTKAVVKYGEQGVKDDLLNNNATAKTKALPDLPKIVRRIPWWIILLAVLAGLVILLLIILICWKIGFFKRRREPGPSLYQAELRHQQEEYYDN